MFYVQILVFHDCGPIVFFFSYKITASIDFLFTFLKKIMCVQLNKKNNHFRNSNFYLFFYENRKKIELEKQYAKIK